MTPKMWPDSNSSPILSNWSLLSNRPKNQYLYTSTNLRADFLLFRTTTTTKMLQSASVKVATTSWLPHILTTRPQTTNCWLWISNTLEEVQSDTNSIFLDFGYILREGRRGGLSQKLLWKYWKIGLSSTSSTTMRSSVDRMLDKLIDWINTGYQR